MLKKCFVCLLIIIAAMPVTAAEVEWLTDVHTALDRARQENKIVCLDFTGSDWCGWCQRLKREVFDTPEFAEFAQTSLIMVEVDFPQHKPQNPEQKAANAQLAATFHITGFPTLVYLNQFGQQLAHGGYIAGGPKNFISQVERIPGIKHADGSVKDQQPDAPPRPPPTFVPIAPATPTHYSELALKGISGSKDRRLALINNQTLMVGETAKIKVQDTRVEVFCKEIREDSVLITIDGKVVELKLGQHQK